MSYRFEELPALLRDFDLKVVEVNGWRDEDPINFRGSVNHHTVGPREGNLPSAWVLKNGRQMRYGKRLPGPLCNAAQARDDSIWVFSWGRANHAGEGGWRGLSGNSSVAGLEVEHTGYLTGDRAEPFPEARVRVSARLHAAWCEFYGFDHRMVCQHKEWAGGRKIDFVGMDGQRFRGLVLEEWMAWKHPSTPIVEAPEMIYPILLGHTNRDGKHPHKFVADGGKIRHLTRAEYYYLIGHQPDSAGRVLSEDERPPLIMTKSHSEFMTWLGYTSASYDFTYSGPANGEES